MSRILGNNDNWIESQDDMAKEAFFQAHFTKERITTNFDIVNCIPRMVTKEQNARLWEGPTIDQVKIVVFGLNGDSASGPDCFTSQFYRSNWDIICEYF